MLIMIHELKQGKLSLAIWAFAIAFLLGICILIYPEMEASMGNVSAMFADMGSFSAAFGMDQLNFGEFTGFFGVECGNVLGLGGACFAALMGIAALAKEEKEHTAEFLLTHPVSRSRVVAEKLCAVAVQLVILNLAAAAVTVLSVLAIREEVELRPMALLFLAYFLMQLEIAAVTFCLSAFLKRGGLGLGIGLAVLFYFMNLLANLTENLEFFKFFTPFGYADGADIIGKEKLNAGYLAVGIAFSLASVGTAFYKYCRKDI